MAYAPDAATLAARAAIADVIARYCHIIDRRRWDAMYQCFHPGATYTFATIDGTVDRFIAGARAVIDPLRISVHQIGNMLIQVDGERANAETYFVAYHRVAADAPTDAPFPGNGSDYEVVIAGRYIDRFECRRGDWRIAHRTGITDWRRTEPAADHGLYDGPSAWRGRPDASDPGLVISL